MIKKRPFILLEVLIAIALVASLLLPLASRPFKIYAKELADFKEFEMERIRELAFSEILQHIDQYIDHKTLTIETATVEKGPYTFSLDHTYSYDVQAHLSYKEQTNEYALLCCDLSLKNSDAANYEKNSTSFSFLLKKS